MLHSVNIICLTIHITEGPWSKVSQAIHDCHAALHAKGTQRIATDIRIGTRIDRGGESQSNFKKVKRVEEILARDTTD